MDKAKKNKDVHIEEETRKHQSSKRDKETEYLEGWQRAKADYANLKKEMEEERMKAMTLAKLLMLADFLPIISNLQMASAELEKNNVANGNAWAQGFIHIAKQFETILEEKGVKRIETKTFDPRFHDAIDREEGKGVASGTILKEVEPGYTLNNEVISPAKVIVAK